MAKIETNFIRPKEEFNVDTGKAKVTYDGYQNNPHEIELKENLEGDVEGVINDTFKENDNNNVVFTDNDSNEHELITSEGFGDALNEALPAALANAQVIKTTWSELKGMRDNKQLIAGSLYRITDYNCTTTQENTRSAGHQFDIVLLALSANKLAEEGWAMMNESNVYDVTFGDGVTKKCYVYTDDDVINVVDVDTKLGYDAEPTEITIDDTNKTVDMHSISYVDMVVENLTYNYFQNSNLSAWKVWYCLDNDTARFAWADNNTPQIYDDGNQLWLIRDASKDIQGKFAWYNSDDNMLVVTNTQTPKVGDVYYSVVNGAIVEDYPGAIDDIKGFGRGVIYRLIDEWNNDVAYDFKNIQFVRPLNDGGYDADDGEDTWVYTFSYWYEDRAIDASVEGQHLINDGEEPTVTSNNIIKGTIIDPTILPNNVIHNIDDGGAYYGITDIFINTNCIGNTITASRNVFISLNSKNIEVQVDAIVIYRGTSSNGPFSDVGIYFDNKKVLTET